MSDIIETIRELPDLLSLKPASEKDIVAAEIRLGFRFSEDYHAYLAAFGAIMAQGIELTGIANAKSRSVVEVTKAAWELNSQVPNTMYVVEDTGVDGRVIWQDQDGGIYQTMPETPPEKIAASLNDYILRRTK